MTEEIQRPTFEDFIVQELRRKQAEQKQIARNIKKRLRQLSTETTVIEKTTSYDTIPNVVDRATDLAENNIEKSEKPLKDFFEHYGRYG